MTAGVGVDIEDIGRFAPLLSKRPFLDRVYTADEQRYLSETLSAQRAAGMFCAKEAFSKAVGTGLSGFSLREVEVVHDERGRPFLRLHGRAAERFGHLRFHLSVSHSRACAVAVVIAEEPV